MALLNSSTRRATIISKECVELLVADKQVGLSITYIVTLSMWKVHHAVADLGGVMHPPLAASNVFLRT